MKAIQFLETKPLEIKTKIVTLKPIFKNSVLVSPVMAGICGSDLHYYLGHKSPEKLKTRLPIVLLHEGIVKNLKTGESMVINPLVPCQKCTNCKTGNENYCFNYRYMASTIHGLAQSAFYYPKDRLIKIPKEVPLEIATLSEPLSVTWNAFEKVKIKHGQKLLVIGDGPIGFLLIFLSAFAKKIVKDRLFWLGRHYNKLKIAREFATLIDTTSNKGQGQISQLKDKLDFIIEAVGGSASDQTINQAITLVKTRGKIMLLGVTDEKVPIRTRPLIDKGITILTSNLVRQKDFRNVLRFLKNKKVHPKLQKLINPRKFVIKTVADYQKALNFAADKKTVGKVLIKFDF